MRQITLNFDGPLGHENGPELSMLLYALNLVGPNGPFTGGEIRISGEDIDVYPADGREPVAIANIAQHNSYIPFSKI